MDSARLAIARSIATPSVASTSPSGLRSTTFISAPWWLEIVDGQVESGHGESTLQSWREAEVALGPAGKKKDLKRAGKVLVAAGATPSTARTNLDRAVGPTLPDGQSVAIKSGTVGELVGAYLGAQCDVLASNDVGLRTLAPAVHQTRVAARRLRSTLRVLGDLVDNDPAEELNNELAWYAELLAASLMRPLAFSSSVAQRTVAAPQRSCLACRRSVLSRGSAPAVAGLSNAEVSRAGLRRSRRTLGRFRCRTSAGHGR